MELESKQFSILREVLRGLRKNRAFGDDFEPVWQSFLKVSTLKNTFKYFWDENKVFGKF